MSTFEKACPTGNHMTEDSIWAEEKACRHCRGTGLVEATRDEYNRHILAQAFDITKEKHKMIKKQWLETGEIPCREC